MTTVPGPSARPLPDPAVEGRMAEVDRPFVSVIVPVYNDSERLQLCLEALEGQTYPANRYEVVVVDNASREPVAPLLTTFPHTIAELEAAPGSYAARNRGIARARGEILAFTDADCVPSCDWIEAGVAAMRRRDVSLVAGHIDVFPRHKSQPNAIELYEMIYAFAPRAHAQAGIAATANLFTLRTVIREVGGFDASLKSFGDVAWTARAVNAGFKVSYADDATVRHPARRSLVALQRRYARFAGGHFDRARTSEGKLRTERLKAILMLAPPLRLATHVLTEPTLRGWGVKAKVIAIAYFARLAYLVEWSRLELGGASRRQ